jgi:hypothetical protein
MRLPDFLIIGAAKAGSNTLYEYLRRHPQVYLTWPKEIEFFARDEIYANGIEWYASFFSEAEPNQVCGEGSVIYTLWPHFPESAARIARWLPQVKLIYIMRHPVERAYSYYVQVFKNALLTQASGRKSESLPKTFEEVIKPKDIQAIKTPVPQPDIIDSHLPKQNPDLYLDGSDYMKQIEQYLRFFPRDQFLFLLLDDLNQKPTDTIQKIFNFIGVDEKIDVMQKDNIVANQASNYPEWFLRTQITAPLKAIPGVASTAALLPQGVRDGVYQLFKIMQSGKLNSERWLPPPMLPETRQMLLEKFHQPNQKLAEFLNRDLSHWDN